MRLRIARNVDTVQRRLALLFQEPQLQKFNSLQHIVERLAPEHARKKRTFS